MRIRIRDPGSCGPGIRDGNNRIQGPGSGIRNKHPGSATMHPL